MLPTTQEMNDVNQAALRARVRCLEMLMALESPEVAHAAQNERNGLSRPSSRPGVTAPVGGAPE